MKKIHQSLTATIRTLFCAAALIAGLALLGAVGKDGGAGLIPTALANNTRKCTERTVKGTYAFALTGSVKDVGPIAASGTTTFDGEGNVSLTGAINTTSLNPILEGTFSGTYSVNSDDCTATATVVTPGVFGYTELNFRAVIVNRGGEIRYLITNPGIVFAGATVKQ